MRDVSVFGGEFGKEGAEWRGEAVEVVTYLVDGLVFGLGEISRGVEGVFFEEKADFVTRGEEVIVADMVMAGCAACDEFGHGVGGEVEVGEEGVGF